MPTVTAPSRLSQNGEAETYFVDTVGTTSTTYTYPLTQDKLTIINNGNATLTVTANGTPYTVVPFSSVAISSQVSSFTIVAASGTQAFSATSYTSEQDIQLTGSNLSQVATLQDAATATGVGTAMSTNGAGVAVLSISGGSATVTFEAQGPNGNWYAVNGRQRGTGVLSTTATTTGLYEINCLGIAMIRANITTFGSGAITVKGQTQPLSPTTDTVFVSGGRTEIATYTKGSPMSGYGDTSYEIRDTNTKTMYMDHRNKGIVEQSINLYNTLNQALTINFYEAYNWDGTNRYGGKVFSATLPAGERFFIVPELSTFEDLTGKTYKEARCLRNPVPLLSMEITASVAPTSGQLYVNVVRSY